VIGALVALGARECRDLLTSHHLGRISFAVRGSPMIVPVNYVYEHPFVVLRTGTGTKLDDVPMSVVAFEIDDADPGGAWGWSVVVEGPAIDITDATDATSRTLRRLPVLPWAPGPRHHWIKIVAGRTTGRRFGEVPWLRS
jgi:nitroimidazol reductase NimA-like FMN-containing flavoprotein (pyridoxamine 5'-phosphate oxidase superfamily)